MDYQPRYSITQTPQLTATNTGVAGTDAMDAYLTGVVDQPAAALASPPPPPPASPTPPPPPPPPHPPATHRKHKHRNSHQLGPQQCLGQGWEGIRRRRLCGNTSRGLSRRSGRKTSSARWWSQSYLPRDDPRMHRLGRLFG